MSGAVDVLIIGAGAAGIAAARHCLAAGRSCLVLEAAARIGGRAFTDTASLGLDFDHGASWLHQAEQNPLVPLAQALGIALYQDGPQRQERVFLPGREATAAERAGFNQAYEAAEAALLARAAADDLPLAAALPWDGPWGLANLHWISRVISAAEPEDFGLQDWAATALGGGNLLPRGGMGGLLARLAQGLPIRLRTPVVAIDARGPALRAETAAGAVAARAILVTVSTGVLAAGGIRFSPALPDAVQDAVAGLPLGLLSKVGFRLARPELLGLGPFGRLERVPEDAADRPMTWVARPFGEPLLTGFLGAGLAWDLARQPPAASIALAREELTRCLGGDALGALGDRVVVTRWGSDPWILGAYSYGLVGAAAARQVLADAALAGGRLRFAGEACHARFAGTVGGAWESGERAAAALLASLD